MSMSAARRGPWILSLFFAGAVAALAMMMILRPAMEPRRFALDAHVEALLECLETSRADGRELCRPLAQEIAGLLGERRPRIHAETPRLTPFNVYVIGSGLVYRRPHCRKEDMDFDLVTLNVHAEDPAALAPDRRSAGFESLDFSLSEHGFLAAGTCIAVRRLPPWQFSKIVTGHYVAGQGFRWVQAFQRLPAQADPGRAMAAQAGRTAPRPPAREIESLLDCQDREGRSARSRCSTEADAVRRTLMALPPPAKTGEGAGRPGVYIVGRAIAFWRPVCSPADPANDVVTMNVYAADTAQLPQERRTTGFASSDFRLSEDGYFADGACLAVRRLPDWRVARIDMGHYDRSKGFVWLRRIHF